MVMLKNCSFDEFNCLIQTKNLYCFGYGDQAKVFFSRHRNTGIAKRLAYIVDNHPDKAGQIVSVNGETVRIITFAQFVNMVDKNIVILITSVFCVEMLSQLDRERCFDGIPTYINLFIDSVSGKSDFVFTKGRKAKIPKRIHYCWFGGKAIPPKLQNYIETWYRYCPDYEIIRWDESNYDVSKNKYMYQAYQAQKWGFVPDYARLDIIYEHGGIYLDTDVEIVKSLDMLLYDEVFCGFEQSGCINFGNGFGAVAKSTFIRMLRDVYDDAEFINNDGSFNLVPCVYYQEPTLEHFHVKFNGTYQNRNGLVIYPSEVLDGVNHWSKETVLTEKTHSLHHYASSWWNNVKMDDAAEELRKNYQRLLQRMGESINE